MALSATNHVNLEIYPIDRPGTLADRELVRKYQEALSAAGVELLERFIPTHILSTLVAQPDALVPFAHHNRNNTTNQYQETVAQQDDWMHPRQHPRTISTHVIAYDLIPHGDGIHLLYAWDVLANF